MNDKQKTMKEKKNRVTHVISRQISNRAKTDFRSSTHGMLLSAAYPLIHQQEIKVTKSIKKVCAQAGFTNLDVNLSLGTKTPSQHLKLLVTIWIQIK
jgi:hypothetical protein